MHYEDDDFDDFEDFDGENDDHEEEQEFGTERAHIESQFFSALKKDEDISMFLYVPHAYITPAVKEQLDIFLLKEAYKNFFIEKNTDILYQDTFITIGVKDESFKIDTLERMLEYYMELEEYEKCAVVKKELDNYKPQK